MSRDPRVQPGQTIVVWFSCGAASAIAAHETLRLYGADCNIRIVNSPVIEEGWDNRRFAADVERWLAHPIEIATNPKFPNASAAEVWERRRFISGTFGAPCTAELKKEARYHWEKNNSHDWLVMGFTSDERKRDERFRLSERQNLLPVLIDQGITKEDCARKLVDAGLTLPDAYAKGYPNANCRGCPKATSPSYWNHVRVVDPAVFAARVEQSRRIGARLVEVRGERIYLDELSPNTMGRPLKSLKMPDCGIFCEEHDPAERELDGAAS